MALREGLSGNLQELGDDTNRHLGRAIVTSGFLNGTAIESRMSPQQRHLLEMVEQRQNGVAQQTDGHVITGTQKHKTDG